MDGPPDGAAAEPPGSARPGSAPPETAPPARPDDDLRRVDGAQRRFEVAIEGLTDADVRRPTAYLPGWNVSHLLTHVARNADSHRRRTEAAARGQLVEQYPGGFAARAAEIEAGAGRDARSLVADVHRSARALDAAWATVAVAAWAFSSPDVGGRWRQLATLPGRRWQELEVHLIDLGPDHTPRDWSADFVATHLPLLRATLDERLPVGATPPPPGHLDPPDELAWLYGRLTRPDLPRLADWS